MDTVKIWNSTPSRQQADEIADALRRGEIVILPTDSVYAITCDALNSKAIASLCRIKGINPEKNNLSIICRAIQINTGEGCHLDAEMIDEACEKIKPEDRSILFIENVGNLVCPAAFDLGEDCKVVVLSVTEGEDKPIKYPDMFAASSVMLLNKIDLLPYLDFDVEKCKEYAKRVNPDIEIIEVSATKGTGMNEWIGWLKNRFSRLA